MNNATDVTIVGTTATVCAPCFEAVGLDPTVGAFAGAAFAIAAPRLVSWLRDAVAKRRRKPDEKN